ncbi:MAG: right-handed parallel beta-helix repeat-containing protein [Sphingobium sp.]|nr:right-handed parallel beta-helix repeat-containing protein [Sphingobium sp.]
MNKPTPITNFGSAIHYVLAMLLGTTATASAQFPSAAPIPSIKDADRPNSEQAFSNVHIFPRPDGMPVVLHVAPLGKATGDGTAARPFGTLAQAQAAVRRSNADQPVQVLLADGTYRLDAPLRFGVEDGGRNGHVVRWEAAPGAHPTLSGGERVQGWRLADRSRNIWVADIPKGSDPRQLWVDGRMAHRAAVEAPRTAFAFFDWGIRIVDPAWRFLERLPDQGRMEVESTGFFTDRRAVIDHIEGDRIILRQPGWRNNLIGYDTFARPVSGEKGRFFVANALAFVRDAGDWFADPAKGLLYYRPEAGRRPDQNEIVLPRLEMLVSIGGSADTPVKDLEFRGLAFRHTSWRGPSGAEGYASQQSGTYLAGDIPDYPADPIRDCSWGCAAFERQRNHWRQQPAAVQVSGAQRILFAETTFAQLGQIALGIGNNAEANSAGPGLAVQSVEVRNSRFGPLAGGAIMVGGTAEEAHHPSRPQMAVRDIVIRNNHIETVSQDYREQAAILVTYATGALILNNDVSDAPYDGIDIGWGWGTNDPGGNTAYMSRARGYYDQPGNRIYETPTILRDTVIFGNRVHGVKRWYPDGGAIYHLSADPGALIAENHIYDVPGGIGIYLDEGSRYVTVRNNVMDGAGLWVNLNAQDDARPRRTNMDNIASGNWYNSGKANGNWSSYLNNRLVDNVAVKGDAWPAEARAVIERAGPRPPETRP